MRRAYFLIAIPGVVVGIAYVILFTTSACQFTRDPSSVRRPRSSPRC